MSDYWSGIGTIQGNLQGVRERKNAGAVEGMQLATLNTLNVSNSQVPHEDGDLERDGAASVEATRTGARGAVAYGRRADTKDYAVVQHEDLAFKHDPGRQAKYLEQPMNTEADTMAKLVGREVKREMGT